MKEILSHFIQIFSIKNIDYPRQMTVLKRLLKDYSKDEILYAIDYYAKKGVSMYSLGYLSKDTMERPITEFKAKQIINTWSDDSGERNKRKFTENNQTRSRKRNNFDLFEESE